MFAAPSGNICATCNLCINISMIWSSVLYYIVWVCYCVKVTRQTEIPGASYIKSDDDFKSIYYTKTLII